MNRAFITLILAMGWGCAAVRAQEPASAPPMTKHQLMKDCMAKQKASDGGMPKEEMKKACKDVTATERENERAEKKQEVGAKSDPTNPP